MKTSNLFKALALTITITCFSNSSFGFKRVVNITGIVMDSENYKPLENTKFFDDENNLLGTSDTNGYFSIKVETGNKGEIDFKLRLSKDGYTSFIQNEHWGDLEGSINSTFYFGLKSEKSKIGKAFSELQTSNKGQNFASVNEGLGKVLTKKEFEKSIEKIKSNNSKVFFEMDGRFYLVSDTGWIELNSGEDFVLVNKENKFMAKDLNDNIRRSKIKYMSTTNKLNLGAEIFTQ